MAISSFARSVGVNHNPPAKHIGEPPHRRRWRNGPLPSARAWTAPVGRRSCQPSRPGRARGAVRCGKFPPRRGLDERLHESVGTAGTRTTHAASWRAACRRGSAPGSAAPRARRVADITWNVDAARHAQQPAQRDLVVARERPGRNLPGNQFAIDVDIEPKSTLLHEPQRRHRGHQLRHGGGLVDGPRGRVRRKLRPRRSGRRGSPRCSRRNMQRLHRSGQIEPRRRRSTGGPQLQVCGDLGLVR